VEDQSEASDSPARPSFLTPVSLQIPAPKRAADSYELAKEEEDVMKKNFRRFLRLVEQHK